jgi:integrase
MNSWRGVRSLPLPNWPEADRTGWEIACRAGARLIRGGRAAHLKPVTRADLERRYGYFLDHLDRADKLRMNRSAAAQVTPEHVQTYLSELRSRVSSVTAYGSIYKLRRMAEILAPDKDLGWLKAIEADLDFAKTPRSKYPRLVSTTALVEAGLTLWREVELSPAHLTPTCVSGHTDPILIQRAAQARDGLMIALLALCPIRMKNFAALELGRSLRKVGETWWIVLAPAETKTRHADERPVPQLLTALLDHYVGQHRAVLSRGDASPQTGPLWIGRSGSAMSVSAVESTIRRTTASSLGIAIGPHMFRTAAATTSASRATHLPGLASALLDHRRSDVTEAHYNRATSHQAAQSYADVLRQIAEHN